jgi:hypothetical protein
VIARLPSPPFRTAIQGFSVALGFLSALLALPILVVLGGSPWLALLPLGASLALALGAPGFGAPLYRLWNRMAALFSIRAGRWVTYVLYFVVMTPVGWVGPRAMLGRTTRSSPWAAISREGPLPSARGATWAIVLVPFLWLLSAFEGRQDQAGSEDVYTLY